MSEKNLEFEKFDGAMRKMLSVSKSELQKREKRYQQKRARKKANLRKAK